MFPGWISRKHFSIYTGKQQMNTKTLVGAVLGGLTLFLLGGLLYGILLADVFTTDVSKEPDVLLLILANLVLGFLLVWLFTRMGTATPMAGSRDGALLGFLFTLSYDLLLYATTTLGNLSTFALDVVVAAVMFALAGAIIGWWLGRGAASAEA